LLLLPTPGGLASSLVMVRPARHGGPLDASDLCWSQAGKAPLAASGTKTAESFLTARGRGKLILVARRGLGETTAGLVVTKGWRHSSPRRGVPLPFAARETSSGVPKLRGCSRRSGELAARLVTRTQEFTSPASVRPSGNAWL